MQHCFQQHMYQYGLLKKYAHTGNSHDRLFNDCQSCNGAENSELQLILALMAGAMTT